MIEKDLSPLLQEAEHHANLDPDHARVDEALGAVDDDEFLRGRTCSIQEVHRQAARTWLGVLQADRVAYKKETTDCLLHKAQVMGFPSLRIFLIRRSLQR